MYAFIESLDLVEISEKTLQYTIYDKFAASFVWYHFYWYGTKTLPQKIEICLALDQLASVLTATQPLAAPYKFIPLSHQQSIHRTIELSMAAESGRSHIRLQYWTSVLLKQEQ